MPTYALSVKYSAKTLAAIRTAGYSTRDEAAQSFYEQLGGKMVAFYWPACPDWDLVAIAELPGADAAYAWLSSREQRAGPAFAPTQSSCVRAPRLTQRLAVS